MKRGAAVAALLVLAAAAVVPASARAEKRRVGISRFAGSEEAIVRQKVMKAVKAHGYELVKSREIDPVVAKTDNGIDSNDGAKLVATELALSAVVMGEVSDKRAKITVRNGVDGSVIGEASFAGANPRKIAVEVGKSFWRRLGSAVERGKPPSGAKKPQKSAVAEAAEDKEEAEGGSEEEGAKAAPAAGGAAGAAGAAAQAGDNEEEPGKARPKPPPRQAEENERPDTMRKRREQEQVEEEENGPPLPWLDASVGGRGFSRSMTYHEPVVAPRPYSLALGPALTVDLSFFPIALATSGPEANFGIDVSVEQAFGVTSTVGPSQNSAFPNGASFPSIVHDFSAALRYRFLFAAYDYVGIFVGGGEHAFAFRSGNGANRGDLRDLADTVYRYIRFGADARIEVASGFALLLGGAYRYVFNNGGQIHTDFFPRLSVAGIDATAGVGYRITSFMEARITAQLRRYFYSMNSQSGDRFIAGGAVDQYIAGGAQLAFILGGGERRKALEAKEAAEAPKAEPADQPMKGRKAKAKGGAAEGGDSGE